MELLDCYLNEIGLHLPRAERADILKELSANLLAQIEDRSVELGRSLDDTEVVAMLQRHGHPTVVASRFRSDQGALIAGRHRLIGPETYPLYLRLLRINLGVTLVLLVLIGGTALVRSEPLPQVAGKTLGLVLLIALQLVAVTLVFVAWDSWSARRRSKWKPQPSYASAPPRWLSAAGLALVSVLAAWWAALPSFPALVLGPAADQLELTTAWSSFHLPVLLLLLAAASQRVVILARPLRVSFLPMTRLVINGAALVLLYVVSQNYPLVVVAGGATDPARYQRLADAANAPSLLWWLWLYFFINFAAHAVYFSRQIRRKREPAPSPRMNVTPTRTP